jgi:putative ABC transport system substrate-binding protein
MAFAQQPPRPKRITLAGCGQPKSEQELADMRRLIRARWAKHGLVEGRDYNETLVFLCQPDAAEDERRLRQVVEARPDLIIVERGSYADGLMRLTRDIPIVFFNVTDPVAWGLVDGYRRPGRNLTGVSNGLLESMVKRIELLKEVRPKARRVAWTNGQGSGPKAVDAFRAELSARAAQIGLVLVDLPLPASAQDVTPEAFAKALCDTKADGFVVYSGLPGLPDMASLQKRCGIPGFSSSPRQVVSGGFASYGHSENAFEHALAISARVLRGEDPATIPVMQPARFDLTINLSAARELGIDVPPAVLARATEVIR